MNTDQLVLISKYVETKIEYEFARRELGADGHTGACIEERKACEVALNEMLSLGTQPAGKQ